MSDRERLAQMILDSPVSLYVHSPESARRLVDYLLSRGVVLMPESGQAEEGPSARFERLAEEFYQETGMMAPGKDVPAALAGLGYKEREAAWIAWRDKRNASPASLSGLAATSDAPKQEHGLAVADCPQCKQESRFRHTHDTAYGLEGTHMAGSERFECAFCGFVVTPNMAAQFPALRFVLDGAV